MNATEESTFSGASNLFGWFDFSMFGMMLTLSALIGVYFGFCSKQDTKVEYLLGGKSMSIWPVAVSLVASYISGVTLMGVPSEIYMFGTLYVLMCFSNIIVALLMNYIYLPVFFQLQLTSTYEYLELRFNRKVRIMSSVLFTLYVVLFIPVVVYVPALAFSQVSGYSVHLITPIVCIVCIFYTMVGGIKAVVWTDFLQSFVMLGACVAVIVLGVHNAGGLSTVFQRSNDGGRLIIFEMDPSLTARNTFWTVLIGTTVMWMGLSVNQGALQKYLSLPSIQSARKALVIYCIGLIMMKGMSIFTGLIVYATYHDCDPVQTQAVKRADQLLPYFVMDTVGNLPGLPGLFIAGIFSAALSTLSSCLNCLSATVFEDFVQPFVKADDDDRKANYIMKGIVVVVGGLCLVLVLIVEKLGGVLELGYSTQGVTLGTLLGLFSLGILFPWANAKGALWGSIVSLTLVSWIVFGAQNAIATGRLTHKKLPTSIEGCDFNVTSYSTITTEVPPEDVDGVFFLFRISYMYYGVIGVLTVIIVGMIVSYFTGFENCKDKNPALFAPFLRKYITAREEVPVQMIITPQEKKLNSKNCKISSDQI